MRNKNIGKEQMLDYILQWAFSIQNNIKDKKTTAEKNGWDDMTASMDVIKSKIDDIVDHIASHEVVQRSEWMQDRYPVFFANKIEEDQTN